VARVFALSSLEGFFFCQSAQRIDWWVMWLPFVVGVGRGRVRGCLVVRALFPSAPFGGRTLPGSPSPTLLSRVRGLFAGGRFHCYYPIVIILYSNPNESLSRFSSPPSSLFFSLYPCHLGVGARVGGFGCPHILQFFLNPRSFLCLFSPFIFFRGVIFDQGHAESNSLSIPVFSVTAGPLVVNAGGGGIG